jgi:putative Ca2+/H+ antiporter (TMEM165/GDT1 family)
VPDAGFLEIVLVAAGAQLAVLPGEKVQFIIAGLSTRYNPLIVVAAASSAFAGWTAVEIVVGDALQRVLPGVVMSALTAVLFLVFAVLLYRSAPRPGETLGGDLDATEPGPRTDGGEVGDLDVTLFGRKVPDALGGFLPIFVLMAVGEFGDKTQLITITLAGTYGATPAIWVGEMLAIVPVSLANAYFFHRFSHRFDLRKAHLVGAAIFTFFGLDTILAIGTGFSVWETVVNAVATALLSFV